MSDDKKTLSNIVDLKTMRERTSGTKEVRKENLVPPPEVPEDYYQFHIAAGLQGEEDGTVTTFIMVGDQEDNSVIFPREVVLTLIAGLIEAYQMSEGDIAAYAAAQKIPTDEPPKDAS